MRHLERIQILVACHKASVLPCNELFLPIHVGAANASGLLPIVRDDTGDNISPKNPSYCELTAQYWGWKNLCADYIGLCHYRRYLCFAPTQDRCNERNQLVASSMTPFNIRKFGLEDAAQMRAVIETADVVTGQPQLVERLYTPRGAKRTAYAHWVAHDRDLIHKEDLDRMLDILESVCAEVGASAREYLRTRYFGGFNCFVMRRELYQTLCELEFETLARLEAQVDRTNYSAQMNRIFGFMGEIISSAFIDYLERKKGCRVRHVPLLYFENTDPTFCYPPIEKPDPISVLFYAPDVLDVLFCAQLRSFLAHTEASRAYDVWVVLGVRKEVRSFYDRMVADYPQVTLRWIDGNLLTREMEEAYGPGLSLLPLLPYALGEYPRMLVFGSNLLFLDSIEALWDTQLAQEELLAAPRDLWMVARYNDVFPQTEAQYLDAQLDNPFDYVSDKVMVWDFAAYRSAFSAEAVCAGMKNSKGNLRNSAEALNVICQGRIQLLPQRWCVWTEGDEAVRRQFAYLPLRFARQWQEARSQPAIVRHGADDPFYPKADLVDLTFWRYTRQTPLYESCLAHMSYLVSVPRRADPMEVLKQKLRGLGAVRDFLARTFPRGSFVYRAVERLLSRRRRGA